MNYLIYDDKVVITTNNHKATFSKKYFEKELLVNPILEELTFDDLKIIWDSLYGVPKNLKNLLLKKIELYSSSTNVNAFKYQNNEYWLDKDNRNSLWNLSNSSLGDLEIVIGDEILTIKSLKLKAFLLKLEVYAYKCFVNTFKHLKKAKTLTNIEDIINYDYTTGYPEKITLE